MERYAIIRWLKIGVFLCALLAGYAPVAYAGEPQNSIRQGTDKLLEILKDPKWKPKSKLQERRKHLRKVADQYFDWEEMAKRSMALHWAERTPQEKSDFISLFSDLLERSYIGKIEGYKDEKILYGAEKIDGDYAVVDTKIITQREVEVPIIYRLRKKPGGWFIYDVSIEGVSLVNNYRAQFNKILLNSSYGELVKRMKTKQIQESSGTAKDTD